jgi:sugar-specific transcriptional regulator TrmB
MNLAILESVGLTQGEVKVFVALLDEGETTTGPLIKKSGVTGSKVYEILDRLAVKGLVSCIMRKKTKYFQAASPTKLLDFVSAQQKKLELQKRKVEELIPSLLSRQSQVSEKQSSQVYEGYEGVKTALSLILETVSPNSFYRAFSIGEELKNKNLVPFFKNYHAKRIDRKIHARLLANEHEKSLFKSMKNIKGLNVRFCENVVPLGVFIFGNNVATITFQEKPTVFLIQSEQIAASYVRFFDDLWKISL